MPIRVVLADDHVVFADAIERLFEATGEIQVVGKAHQADKAISLVSERHPDVLVLDLMMPGGGGGAVLRSLSSAGDAVPTIILTGTDDLDAMKLALSLGARGFLTKTRSSAQLVEAVRAVHDGGTYIGATMGEGDGASSVRSAARSTSSVAVSEDDVGLSTREAQVLKLVAYGHTNKEIAEQLGLSVKTVEGYRARVAEKLNAGSRAELVRHAIRRGLMDGEPPE